MYSWERKGKIYERIIARLRMFTDIIALDYKEKFIKVIRKNGTGIIIPVPELKKDDIDFLRDELVKA